MDRHEGSLKTGSRWIATMHEWAAKVDTALEVKDRQIGDLSERIQKLEDNRS